MFLYTNNTYVEAKMKNNTIYNNAKENELFRYEFTKMCRIFVLKFIKC